jgi:alpha-ribazole phosphatase CobZ
MSYHEISAATYRDLNNHQVNRQSGPGKTVQGESLRYYYREENISVMFEIEERLLQKGITLDAVVESAMGLYVSHGMDEDQARTELHRKIKKYFRDPNVSSLILGAILLEDELYWKRNDSEIKEDPVFLLSDEIIGMAIAECIGGTYARFEFTRYDQRKPGILATLGPFLDDAVAGLIAGCTSRLYTECCECQENP